VTFAKTIVDPTAGVVISSGDGLQVSEIVTAP